MKKVLLIVCGIIILAALSTYMLIENVSLRNKIHALESDNKNLQSQVINLENQVVNLVGEKADLENNVKRLEEEKSGLEKVISNLENQVRDLQGQIEPLYLQIEDLKAIVAMKKSILYANETLIYQPDTQKTWSFSVTYSGLLLVRVQMIPPSEYALPDRIEIAVNLSSKPYITRSGTLNLTPGPGEYYYTSTALFPVADLSFPVNLQVTVKNSSPYTIKLMITITFVY